MAKLKRAIQKTTVCFRNDGSSRLELKTNKVGVRNVVMEWGKKNSIKPY